MELLLHCVLCVILVALCKSNNDLSTVTLNTPAGRMTGLVHVYPKSGELCHEFRGIPYAKPPVGSLRFSKPEPLPRWEGILDGTKYGSACMQPAVEFLPGFMRVNTSEDCLFLNLYVPRNLNQKLSVMVWIHGGGFAIGHSNRYDGERIAMEGNVIVVTINYRLGIFGFLSVGHPAARGNFGLWDQKLALQWVHNNIAAFGGDHKSVTIFGESAGGFSVSFQSLIPSNKGLFQRVIAQSGVVSRTSILKANSIEKNVKTLYEKSSCSPEDLYKLVECLRGKSADDLLQMTNIFASMPVDTLMYENPDQPVVDGELFKDHPIESLEDDSSEVSKFFRSLDVIAGTTSEEGSLLYMTLMPGFQQHYGFNVSDGIPSDVACAGMISQFVDLYFDGDSVVKEKLCKYYSAELLPEQSVKATEFWADIIFYISTDDMLQYHAPGKGHTYQYVVSKISPRPFGPSAPAWFSGCGHGDELLYFFNYSKALTTNQEIEFSDAEIDFADKLVHYWTSFAKFGVPDGGEGSIPWPEYDAKAKRYIDFNVPISQKSSFKKETLTFWKNEIPVLNVESFEEHLRDEL